MGGTGAVIWVLLSVGVVAIFVATLVARRRRYRDYEEHDGYDE